MSQTQHHSSQKEDPSTAHLGVFIALRRALENLCKEKQDLKIRIKQMKEEKSPEMTKMQQITEMLKENEEQRKCSTSSKKWRKNEGLQVMFDEVLRRNTQLLREKEQKELLWKLAIQAPSHRER